MPTWITTSVIATTKTTWYLGAVMIFEFLNLPEGQIGILAILMVIDFISGIGKQYRVDPKKITSHKGWIWIIQKAGTFIAVFTVALIFKGLWMDGSTYINAMLAILIMAEGYSVIQNVYAIRTGTMLPEFDVISTILKGFSEFLKIKIESAINQKQKPDDKNTP